MNKKIVLVSLAVLLIIGRVGSMVFAREKVCSGTIIILNGPSGSGKSSIQKEFQKLMMPTLWIKLGVDNLFDNPMPEITLDNIAFWQSKNPIRWVESSQDAQGNKLITLFVGPQGQKVAYAMNSAIAAYAQEGCNVIVDYIAYDPAWLADLEKKCAQCKTYYVAIDIPLEVLEQREAARATSPQGHARSHYSSVYGDRHYDLRVDTGSNTAQEVAAQLQKLIKA